jgi:ribonuclease T2
MKQKTRLLSFLVVLLIAIVVFFTHIRNPPSPAPSQQGPAPATEQTGAPASAQQASPSTERETANGSTRHTRRRSRPAADSTPGKFDFYLLNLSWSPAYCATHARDAECTRHLAFTLHGLWPQNDDGTYPENCSNVAGPDPSTLSDIVPDASLVTHEWKTHGTCTGLSPAAWVALLHRAVQAVKTPPQLDTLHHKESTTPAQIITLFSQANPGFPKQSLALSCGSNTLTQAEICMNTSLQPIACEEVKTCGATTISVVPVTQ